METIKLTQMEMTTFHGLVKFPWMNDRELADELGLKLSTVTAIRRRLDERGYFTTVRVPMMERLGCEILVIGSTKFRRAVGGENTYKQALSKLGIATNAYLALATKEYGMFISTYVDYTSLCMDMDEITSFFAHQQAMDESSWPHDIFPFSLSEVLRFFDYSPVLARHFGIKDIAATVKNLKPRASERVHLTKKEKRILYGLCKYPDAVDEFVAEKVGVSRQAVSIKRRLFLENGLMKVLRIPDLQKLGFEIVALAKCRMNPLAEKSTRSEGIRFLLNKVPIFFLVSAKHQLLGMCAYRDFEEYNRVWNEFMSFFETHEITTSEPEGRLFSTKELAVLKNHDYSSLLAKAWDIRETR